MVVSALPWEGSTVLYNLDSCGEGNYTIQCTIYDTLGRFASDTVFVEVQSPGTGEPSDPTDGDFDLPSALIGVGAGAVAMVAFFVVISLIRRRK